MPEAGKSVRATFLPPRPSASLAASPTSLALGSGPVTLTATATNAIIIGLTANGANILPGACTGGTTCTATHTLSDDTTYVLTVRNAAGVRDTDSARVTVSRPPNLGGPPEATSSPTITVNNGQTSSAVILQGRDLDGCVGQYEIVLNTDGFGIATVDTVNGGRMTCSTPNILRGSITVQGSSVGSSSFTYTIKKVLPNGDDSESLPRTVNVVVR